MILGANTVVEDFFISYTQADLSWARWIAHTLKAAGYRTVLQVSDFRPGENFIKLMNQALRDSSRMLAVASPAYFRSRYAEEEWTAAMAGDRLLLVRVAEFELPPLLAPRIYINLVGRNEVDAKEELLVGVRTKDAPPMAERHVANALEPPFPGGNSDPHEAFRPSPLPPPPARLIGREQILEDLVTTMIARAPLSTAVLGAPGIGKSAICLTALHDERVQRRFKDRRYFVRCGGSMTAEAVVGEIAKVLGIRVLGSDELRPQILVGLRHGAVALVLDGADTPWWHDSVRFQELLLQLARIPRLALVASLRGKALPDGLKSRDPIEALPLPLAHARQMFLSITGRRHAKDEHLDGLLKELDGVPLAIEVLARLAELVADLTGLWKQLTEQKLASLILNRIGPASELSLTVSFETSMKSQRMNGEGVRLLGLLGILPDGIAHEDLDQLLPDVGMNAAWTLLEVGLAFDEKTRLRVLRPIGDFANSEHPPETDDVDRAIVHYGDLAKQLGPKVGEAGGALAAARLSAELKNLDAMLRLGIKDDHPQPSIFAAACLTHFMRFSGLGSTEVLKLARKSATGVGDPALEAATLKGLGHIAQVRSKPSEAERYYLDSFEIYRRENDLVGQAKSTKGLGHIALKHDLLAKAQGCYEDALALFDRAGLPLGRADCIAGLGDVAFAHEDYGEAQRYYEEAHPLYRDLGHIRGEANCMADLGEIALRRGEHDAAEPPYRQARPLYAEIGHIQGVAKCHRGLGDVSCARRNYIKARVEYSRALNLYTQVGDVKEQARCLQALGDTARESQHYNKAKKYYETASNLYKQIGDTNNEEKCIKAIGRIKGAQGPRSRETENRANRQRENT